MKSAFLLLLLSSLFTYTIKAQQRVDLTDSVTAEKYYLKLARQHKNAGIGFVIGGGTIALAGGLIWFISPVAGITGSSESVESARRSGQQTLLIGTGLAAVSILFFSESKMNKQKALLYAGTSNLSLPVHGNKNLLCIGTKINF